MVGSASQTLMRGPSRGAHAGWLGGVGVGGVVRVWRARGRMVCMEGSLLLCDRDPVAVEVQNTPEDMN